MASSNLSVPHKISNNTDSDECYTPDLVVLPLLGHLPKDKLYYECMSNFSSNIVNLFNFFKHNIVGSN